MSPTKISHLRQLIYNNVLPIPANNVLPLPAFTNWSTRDKTTARLLQTHCRGFKHWFMNYKILERFVGQISGSFYIGVVVLFYYFILDRRKAVEREQKWKMVPRIGSILEDYYTHKIVPLFIHCLENLKGLIGNFRL